MSLILPLKHYIINPEFIDNKELKNIFESLSVRKPAKKKRLFKRKANFSVYIVQCNVGAFYTGYTNNLQNRIKLHNSGKGAKYVARKLPVVLVYAKNYKYYRLAIQAEKDIKQLSRKQKEKLVDSFTRFND